MPMSPVSTGDREFFAALGEVVFGNPFSEERAQKIVRLVHDAALGDLDSNREALAHVVESRLGPLLRDGAPALQRLRAEDRSLLEPRMHTVTGAHTLLYPDFAPSTYLRDVRGSSPVRLATSAYVPRRR
jgi:hypothetical protein